jgi:DNA-binding beta-propeller fold protein YncE
LLAALQREPAAIAEMHATRSAPGDLTEWIQLSPDARVIAAGGARTTVDLFDAATYRFLRKIDVGAGTTAGDFSPDGRMLAVAAVDERIVAIDVHAGAVRGDASVGGAVGAILFAPEGDTLFTAEANHLVPRDPATLDPSGPPVPSKGGPITAMASSADGRWLVTTSLPPDGLRGHTALWDERGLAVVGHPFPVGGNDVALSPDGRTAAIAAAQNSNRTSVDDLVGKLVFLDLRTGEQRLAEGYTPEGGAAIGLTGLAFSADGQTVISTGDDHRILIWDASSATIDQAFDDPSGLIGFSPLLSPDGATAFTIDVDGNIVAWDVQGDRRVGRSFTAGSDSTYCCWPYLAISPNGGTLAVFQVPLSHHGNQGSIRLVDSSTLESLSPSSSTTTTGRDGPWP